MTVEQTSVVDAISTDYLGRVKLTVADHLRWDDEHILALQQKLNAYLAFLDSGEVYVTYPQAKGRDFLIHVVALYRPNESANKFLAKAKKCIEDAGYSLLIGPLNGAYADDAA